MLTEKKKTFSGGLVSHQSPAFQEEFPSLAPEEKGKEAKKEEENKDTQYGPGPSLRPQSKSALLPCCTVLSSCSCEIGKAYQTYLSECKNAFSH